MELWTFSWQCLFACSEKFNRNCIIWTNRQHKITFSQSDLHFVSTFSSKDSRSEDFLTWNFSFLIRSIRHATSQQMEAAIWSSVRKLQLRATRVVKRKQLRTQPSNHHPESMAASLFRRDLCRRHRLRAIVTCIFLLRRSLARATRKTRRRHTNCMWKLTS